MYFPSGPNNKDHSKVFIEISFNADPGRIQSPSQIESALIGRAVNGFVTKVPRTATSRFAFKNPESEKARIT